MAHRRNIGPTLAKTSHAPQPAVERARESGTRLSAPSATVLVADDDADARTALAQLLIGEGYDVIEAVDGAQALELLASAADGGLPLPDVVLLDFVMPGFSGLGILRVMRRFERVPPTIIMTAFVDPSVETFARNLGAVRVLRKPIDERALTEIVLACAQRQAGAARDA